MFPGSLATNITVLFYRNCEIAHADNDPAGQTAWHRQLFWPPRHGCARALVANFLLQIIRYRTYKCITVPLVDLKPRLKFTV